MRELSKLLQIENVFFEPEEHDWGQAVKERNEVGFFSGLMWFRSARVPNLIKARKIYESNQSVIVDSYYDKAIKSYIGKKGMEWLISPKDEYFKVAKKIVEIDWETLPNVTHIVTFELSKEEWLRNLNLRRRVLDDDEELKNSFDTQKYFIEAAEQLQNDFGIKHIRLKVNNGNPKEVAEKILRML